MKVKQCVQRTTTTEVELEFPVYIQDDIGEEHTYICTYRYELQSPHVPTFLVTEIVETSDGFEIKRGSSMTVDADIANNKVSVSEWDTAVKRFERWAESQLVLLKATT